MEILSSLNRLRTAWEASNTLMPLIEEAQGKLTSLDLQAHSTLLSHSATEEGRPPEMPPILPPRIHQDKTDHLTRQEHGRSHAFLFCLLLFDGVVTSVDLFHNHIALTLLNTGLLMGLSVCVIVALVRQHGAAMKRSLKGMTWGTLGYLSISLVGAHTFYYFVVLFENPDAMNNQWEWVKIVSSLSPLSSPFLSGLYIFSIACSFSLGIAGLVLLRMSRGEYHISPSVGTK
jgi:hypothetical protein